MQGHSWLCAVCECVCVHLSNTFPHAWVYIVSSLYMCKRIGNWESKKIEAKVPTLRPWLRYAPPFPTSFLKPYTSTVFFKKTEKNLFRSASATAVMESGIGNRPTIPSKMGSMNVSIPATKPYLDLFAGKRF